MFKKRRGINIPYEKQGLIYFNCVNYDDMPDEVKNKITNLCKEVGKEYADVLFVPDELHPWQLESSEECVKNDTRLEFPNGCTFMRFSRDSSYPG